MNYNEMKKVNPFDAEYHKLLRHILKNGSTKGDRTGTGTVDTFGYQMRFDLSKGKFPLLTTKKIHLRSIIHELLWFLSGDTNIKYLTDNKVSIWNEWADETTGELGPVYGYQWRHWPAYSGGEVDQIKEVIASIKNNPNSRRHIVSAWNVGQLDQMALPPCHLLFQFDVTDGRLSLQLYQRSTDVFLGLPFNIASYATLLMMFAQVCGLQLGTFIWTGGSNHLYLNHLEQTNLQLTREPREAPVMKINPEVKDIFDFKYEDFHLGGYTPHDHIKADISV